ncbi:TPA: restriction endonuclease subunit S [Vibrio parahaemolyticus]|nr:type I restriction endonuclease subunit S [Vibrio parahaemolyticus]EGR1762816.1 type I restriction endonuclease subunit S [Vibrio parahaemolyticus]
MSEMPKGWVEIPLEQVATWGSGGTPKRSEPSYYGGDVPWVKTGDLGPRYLKEASEYISQLGLEKSSAKLFPKGSVAIAMYGATIGKTSILDFEASTNQACAVGYPIDGVILTDFLYYFLTSEKQNFIKKGKGGAQPNISQQLIKAHDIRLPSLPEQKRIVEKLDEVLAQVDTIKARLDGIPDLLKRFRQSVLASAVSGKLTEEWRGNSDYIFNEDAKANFPRSWSVKVIDDVADVKGGKRLPKGEELVSEDTGFPYIRAGQLKFGTVITGSEARNSQMYLLPHVQSQISRYIVSEGDGYITIVGASIGDAGTIPTSHDGANLTENAAKLCNFVSDYNNEFLGLWLRSEILQSLIKLEIKSGAQGKLALIRIKALPCPKPAVDEQKEIVRLVEQYFSFADTIEAQVKKAQARVDNLTQSILAKAFRGELVPQNDDDEPAEVLLERIAKARKEAEALAKAAKKAEAAKKRAANKARV